eukprot:scaffold426_cov219-Amphora_coffeaeformis.AAC.45
MSSVPHYSQRPKAKTPSSQHARRRNKKRFVTGKQVVQPHLEFALDDPEGTVLGWSRFRQSNWHSSWS